MCGSGKNSADREDAAGETDMNESKTRRGTITFLAGCMFSGKTTELLRRLAAYPPGSSVVFKHVTDRRYCANAVVSHDGKTWPAVPITAAGEVLPHVEPGIRMVAVEEAHFFDDRVIEVAQELADRGVNVILTALDCDSWGRPIAIAQRLLDLADEPIIKQTVCARCGGVGCRSQRLTPIIDGNMVGGSESYEPRCEACLQPPPEPPPEMA